MADFADVPAAEALRLKTFVAAKEDPLAVMSAYDLSSGDAALGAVAKYSGFRRRYAPILALAEGVEKKPLDFDSASRVCEALSRIEARVFDSGRWSLVARADFRSRAAIEIVSEQDLHTRHMAFLSATSLRPYEAASLGAGTLFELRSHGKHNSLKELTVRAPSLALRLGALQVANADDVVTAWFYDPAIDGEVTTEKIAALARKNRVPVPFHFAATGESVGVGVENRFFETLAGTAALGRASRLPRAKRAEFLRVYQALDGVSAHLKELPGYRHLMRHLARMQTTEVPGVLNGMIATEDDKAKSWTTLAAFIVHDIRRASLAEDWRTIRDYKMLLRQIWCLGDDFVIEKIGRPLKYQVFESLEINNALSRPETALVPMGRRAVTPNLTRRTRKNKQFVDRASNRSIGRSQNEAYKQVDKERAP